MTITLVYPYGHRRDVLEVRTIQARKLIAACVKARLPRCYVCAAKIVKCEEQRPN